MIALLIWLAGCAFLGWVVWHWNLWQQLFGLVVWTAVFAWVVGGASWLGKHLGASAMRRGAVASSNPLIDALNRAAKRAGEKPASHAEPQQPQ